MIFSALGVECHWKKKGGKINSASGFLGIYRVYQIFISSCDSFMCFVREEIVSVSLSFSQLLMIFVLTVDLPPGIHFIGSAVYWRGSK